MARSPRADEAGGLDHVLNRANCGVKMFRQEGDFMAFEKVLHEALRLDKIELYAYQIMTTHWHLMLRPLVDGEMGRFCKWVCGTHAMRYYNHYRTTGTTDAPNFATADHRPCFAIQPPQPRLQAS